MAFQNFFVIWPPGASVTTWKLEPTSPWSIREKHPGGFFTSFVLSSCTPGHETEQWKPGCFWGVFKWGPWWQFGGETCYFWFRLLRLFCQMISFSPCVFEAHRIDWSLSQTIPHHFFLFSSFLWNSKSLFRLGSWDDVEQSGRGSGPITIVHFIFMLPFYLAFLNSFEMNFLSALLWPCESKELSY